MGQRLYKNIRTSVERIVYYNQESHWGVLSVVNTLKDDPFFYESSLYLAGCFQGLYEGCEIEYSGNFACHPKYGSQIVIETVRVIKDLKTKEAILNFLAKSSIKGISTQLALKIYNKFKEKSIKVVLNEPHRIKEIVGIGEGTYQAVVASINDYKQHEDLVEYCVSLGIPNSILEELKNTLGSNALPILKSNIFTILDFTDKLTFSQLDNIALKSGMAPDDPRRLKACLIVCLKNRVMMTSSTGCDTNELKAQFLKRIGISTLSLYTGTLNQLVAEKKVILEGSHAFLRYYYDKEKFIARALANLLLLPIQEKPKESVIKDAINSFPFELNDQQKAAVHGILEHRVSILTGGPGSGKSTITKALVDILEESQIPYFLLSPTGKATRRMEECTGKPAQTIHKFLGVQRSLDSAELPHVEDNTYLIIDECSMLDIMMLAKLLEISIKVPINIILVGDKDQLPSVQAGDVLADLLASKVVPAFILTDIMRQAKDSHIIEYCAEVNNGRALKPCKYSDFHYEEYDDSNDIVNDLQDIFIDEVKKYGLRDVQVITPYKKGELGVNLLNTELSDYYNSADPHDTWGYKCGDKIMQVINDYKKNIFNGEVGIISYITNSGITVSFKDNLEINYKAGDTKNVTLAYACTCHKSQGAEYSSVIVILDDSTGKFLLTRKLLYTAMSRGKKKVYILSKRGCLESCVDNIYEFPRITKLTSFIQGALNSELEYLSKVDY